MSRILLSIYSLSMVLVIVLTAPWWLWQMMRTGKYREGLSERLGRIPRRLGTGSERSVWVHAVSVGEVLAASRLIEELASALPGIPVYVSTTTRTGQTLARERFGAAQVFYFPLDFAFAMRAWLRFLRPALVVLVESELWPRMLVECSRAGVPVAVVNGRVSDRSWPRYQRLRVLWRPLLGSLAVVLAQSERDAERLRALGAAGAAGAGAAGTERAAGAAGVVAAGNLKYDIRVAAPAPATAEMQARLAPGVPSAIRVVVCGSTLSGEEELLLDALPLAEILTVLAPRHPERFDAVARLLAGRGLPFVRRSDWAQSDGEQPDWARTAPGQDFRGQDFRGQGEAIPGRHATLSPGTVVLLDSVGELASVYSLATLAVVGGGFLSTGGHNPLEPAQFGVPVLMGARYANFRDVVEALLREQAVVLSDPAGLRAALRSLLADPDRLRAIGARGRRVFEQQAGATSRTLAALLTLISGSTMTADVPPAGVDAAVEDGSRGEQVLR